jgi:hypothetical protein
MRRVLADDMRRQATDDADGGRSAAPVLVAHQDAYEDAEEWQ